MYLRNLDKHGRAAEKNLDLRIRKTRRAIRSGLVKACEAKPYEHVSVADICRVSMVSRTTFYDHYTGKDALLAEVVSFLLEDITPALEGLWFGEGGDSRAVARHLADICSPFVSGERVTCTSVSARHVVRYLPIGRADASMMTCFPWPRRSTPRSS